MPRVAKALIDVADASLAERLILPWRDPVAVLAPFADEPYAVLLLSRGPGARWSYFARRPARVESIGPDDADRDFERLRRMLGPRAAHDVEAPPFQGGVIGLIAYEFGDRLEPLGLPRDPDWPDLILADYPALLAFDHRAERVVAVGRGRDAECAKQFARRAATWMTRPPPYRPQTDQPAADRLDRVTPADAYEASVADVIGRIATGEIFQANIAAAWTGTLSADASPFAVFERLQAQSPAPHCAYWRLPGRALVSHSPERFVSLGANGAVETRPIKGTRPRGATPAQDDQMRAELFASDKDRAENLMIVDLMRNDISRVCAPGTVRAPGLFAVESYPSVHHLVSTVTGALKAGRDAADLLAATFPPGSITGAPKIQAMRVIAQHEPPRGPWCGSLFWAGADGALDSSVLIRTAGFVETPAGWRFRACAGAGIVADSDPVAERLETEVKISGLARALTESGA